MKTEKDKIPKPNVNWKGHMREKLEIVNDSLRNLKKELIYCSETSDMPITVTTRESTVEGIDALIGIFKDQIHRLEQIPKFSQLAVDLSSIKNEQYFKRK